MFINVTRQKIIIPVRIIAITMKKPLFLHENITRAVYRRDQIFHRTITYLFLIIIHNLNRRLTKESAIRQKLRHFVRLNI